jgi:hypothetical protein
MLSFYCALLPGPEPVRIKMTMSTAYWITPALLEVIIRLHTVADGRHLTNNTLESYVIDANTLTLNMVKTHCKYNHKQDVYICTNWLKTYKIAY